MEFVDCNVEGDGIWGIWKRAEEEVYKRAVLKGCRARADIIYRLI